MKLKSFLSVKSYRQWKELSVKNMTLSARKSKQQKKQRKEEREAAERQRKEEREAAERHDQLLCDIEKAKLALDKKE